MTTRTLTDTATIAQDISLGGILRLNVPNNAIDFTKLVAATQTAYIGSTGAGNFVERTLAQLTSDIIVFSGDSGAGGVKGSVPAPAAGDAAAHKFLKASGAWTQPAASDISGLAASATTDTTNASNISSGTLGAARLPNPSVSTLGGVKSLASVSHQFLTQIGTDGSVSQAQPAASDISGLAASATTDTTNASNISSGTLGAARLPAALSSSTSLNGLNVSASTGTLTVANGKTATINNTLTLTGTDSSSVAFGAGGTIGGTGYAVTGQVPGTTTNDNANAGSIGEHTNSVVATPGTSLSSGVAINVTSMPLTAGDWDVSAIGYFHLSTTTNLQYAAVSISTVSLTQNGTAGNYGEITLNVVPGFAQDIGVATGTIRLSLSGTTTVYLVAAAGFTVSTLSVWGALRARRMR